MKALYIASTGMAAQERNVEVISNNIANMRTTGFKRQRAEFQDLLYQAYRRAGSSTSEAGMMVTVDGYQLEPGIIIPEDATAVSISRDGVVEAFINGAGEPVQLGQLQMARFVNKAGLESMGDNLFLETAASGEAQIGVPGVDGMGSLLQGYLESANVNAVTEMADLISAQRAYEMNARVISGADQMLQATAQLR